jgi:hypothetical protein
MKGERLLLQSTVPRGATATSAPLTSPSLAWSVTPEAGPRACFEAMRKSFYKILTPMLLMISGCLTASSALAQQIRRVDNLDHGSTWVGSREKVEVAVRVTTSQATTEVEGATQGRILRRVVTVGSRQFSSKSNGTSRARVILAGQTIRDTGLINGVVDNLPAQFTEIAKVRSGSLSLGGWCSVRAEASAGGGHQLTVVARTRSGSNPAAHLSGRAQSWLVGTGQVIVDVLWGVASGRVELALEGFNTTLAMTLPTERSTISGSSLSVQATTIDWRFKLKLKAKVFGHTVWSDTIVDEEGSAHVREVMTGGM